MKKLFKNKVEALYGLLDDAGDDAEGNITLFINMRHHKGYLILFPTVRLS